MGEVVSYNEDSPRCTFCGKSEHQVRKLVTGPSAAICDECINLCVEIISEEARKDAAGGIVPLPSPAAVKRHLDRYVVGQDSAKRTLAVAVRNHYKRVNMDMMDAASTLHVRSRGRGQDVGNPAGDETMAHVRVDKSNILMMGPTGVGKTYLAKTLASAMDVPFAMTDATTLTEAGYVGDDVETVLQRLVQAADGDVEMAQHGIIYIDEIDLGILGLLVPTPAKMLYDYGLIGGALMLIMILLAYLRSPQPEFAFALAFSMLTLQGAAQPLVAMTLIMITLFAPVQRPAEFAEPTPSRKSIRPATPVALGGAP